jgi:hypothetical protein
MSDVTVIQQESATPLAIANPMAILSAAIEKGASAETLERLMGLQERYQANQARIAYGQAMAKAQADMRPISTNASNPQTHSQYANYHALDSVIRPIYTSNGFSLSFDTIGEAPPECIMIVCKVQHAEGHCETFHLPMPADGKGAKGGDVMTKTHATGAAITYGRRYLLGMVFNIAVANDNDGNTASNDAPKLIDEAQFRYLQDLIERGEAVESKILAHLKKDKLEGLTQKDFKWAEGMLRSRIAEIQKQAKLSSSPQQGVK